MVLQIIWHFFTSRSRSKSNSWISSGIRTMAPIFAPKPFQLKARVPTFIHCIYVPDSLSTNLVRFFGTTYRKYPKLNYFRWNDTDSYRREQPKAPKVVVREVCKLIKENKWTIRLQFEIRRLVPHFDHLIVWNVMEGLGVNHPKECVAWFRFVERSGFRHDQATHLRLFEILGANRMLYVSRIILYDMPNKGVGWHENMFCTLMESYARAGIIQQAVKFFWKMKDLGVERTIHTYNVLFKLQMRRGRYKQANSYFRMMLEEGAVQPTISTYGIMIWGFLLCRQFSLASSYLEEMGTKGFWPNFVILSILIHGYVRVPDMEKAEKFFLEVKRRKVMNPTLETYTSMIKGYCLAGRIHDALKMFEEMKSVGVAPDVKTYSLLLPEMCNDADIISLTQNMLEDLVKNKIAPRNLSIFRKLIHSHCRFGNTESAIYVLKAMHRLSVTPDPGHYGMVIEHLCKNGKFTRAINVLDRLIEKELILCSFTNSMPLHSDAFNPIIEYLCLHGETKKADTVNRQLLKMGVFDHLAFDNISHGFLLEGDPESSYVILKIMEKKHYCGKEETYKLLVKSFFDKGEASEAKRAFDSMIKNGHHPDPNMFRLVIEKLFEDGKVQTASQVMKTMVEKEAMKQNMDLVDKVLDALLTRGHVEEAIGRISLLMSAGCIVELDTIISRLFDRSQFSAALDVVEFCLEKDTLLSSSSYNRALDSYLSAERLIDAYALLCKVTLKGIATNWSGLENLIQCLDEQGNTSLADILKKKVRREEKKVIRR